MPASRNPLALCLAACLLLAACSDEGPKPRNLILFVPDGLRAMQVNAEAAPTLAALRDRGVNFANPHALFPTFTMPNASGMATGHYLGDTGTFSNTIFTGYPVAPAGGSMTPFIENDPVLGDIDVHFAGDYLNETTILNAARARGFSTAQIGKLGPTLQFDHTERSGERTITIDDSTGSAAGIPLSEPVKAALAAAGLPLAAPTRGDNGKAGDAKTPGTIVANVTQQAYFADVAAKVVLPMFKARKQPFLLMFWSRDPDGTQHNQGDSLLSVTPGINGPTSLAAVKNADNNLKQLMNALRDLGLAETTDIVIAADHGFECSPHRDCAGNQDQRVNAGSCDGKAWLEGRWPDWTRYAKHNIRADQPGKKHRLRAEKNKHGEPSVAGNGHVGMHRRRRRITAAECRLFLLDCWRLIESSCGGRFCHGSSME